MLMLSSKICRWDQITSILTLCSHSLKIINIADIERTTNLFFLFSFVLRCYIPLSTFSDLPYTTYRGWSKKKGCPKCLIECICIFYLVIHIHANYGIQGTVIEEMSVCIRLLLFPYSLVIKNITLHIPNNVINFFLRLVIYTNYTCMLPL